MSLLFTEGFGRYTPVTDTVVNYHERTAAQLAAADWVPTFFGQLASLYGGPRLGPHPSVPGSSALMFGKPVRPNPGYAVNAGMSAKWESPVTTTKPYILGFTYYAQFLPAAAGTASNIPYSTYVGSMILDAPAKLANALVAPTQAFFAINRERKIQVPNSAGTSDVTVTPAPPLVEGNTYHFEVRVDPLTKNVRVWLDDGLIADYTHWSTLPLNRPGIRLDSVDNSFVTGSLQTAVFSDIYVLIEDDVVPNTRLGKTTRITTRRPMSDIQAQFAKVSDYPTNAETVGALLVTPPTGFIVADAVGQKDIYALTPATISAQKIHGVVTKTIAANFSSVSYDLSPLVSSVGVEATVPLPLPPISAYTDLVAVFPTDPATGLPWTTAAANAINVGLTVEPTI